MICFTNDTPLTRITKLSDLLDRVFARVYTIEMSPPDETAFQEFEEEYMKIKNGERPTP